MDPELKVRWMAHLCGLCLTLRDEAGQASRVLTGYDVLLLSVLVEAQAGTAETETAAPCPLRGMRTAAVVPASNPGARLAAAGSLLAGAAAMEDKWRDGDLPVWVGPAARRWTDSTGARGRSLAHETGLDPGVLSRAALAAADEEGGGGDLTQMLAPSGRGVAELFAHTAEVAGRPANRQPLWELGDAFGRLVHLLDAVEDFARDARRGAFNPLEATSTPAEDARRMADALAADIVASLERTEMADPQLVRVLFGPVIQRAIARHFDGTTSRPAATAAVAVAAVPALVLGMFGGRRRWRRRPPYYNDPYGPPPGYGYGYGRRGPSCCDLLACDCCANMACNDCCGGGGGDDDCCVCCF